MSNSQNPMALVIRDVPLASAPSQQSNIIRLPIERIEPQYTLLGLEKAIEEFMNSMHGVKAKATIVWYKPRLDNLLKYFGNVAVQDIRTKDLRKWRDTQTDRTTRWDNHPSRPTQQGGLAPWTRHGYVRAVRRLFQWLQDEELIEKNPAERLETPLLPEEPPKNIRLEDIKLILETAKPNTRDYALVRFLATSGARLAGVTGLKWEDISLETGRATVREKGKGGNGRSRIVYFKEETRKALEKWRGESSGTSGPVFPSQRGKSLTEAGVYQIIERLAKKAGISGRWNPHSFRHAFAIEMINNGASIAHVSQIMGHKDPQITMRFYARFFDQALKQAHDRFSAID